jgi:hypothetical protein
LALGVVRVIKRRKNIVQTVRSAGFGTIWDLDPGVILFWFYSLPQEGTDRQRKNDKRRYRKKRNKLLSFGRNVTQARSAVSLGTSLFVVCWHCWFMVVREQSYVYWDPRPEFGHTMNANRPPTGSSWARPGTRVTVVNHHLNLLCTFRLQLVCCRQLPGTLDGG